MIQLFESHRKELEASGLKPETIEAAGLHSEHDRAKLASMLNLRSWPLARGCGLVFPYHDETGTVVMHRVKPERPQTENGKPRKYLSPCGSRSRVYFPPDVRRAIVDGTPEILISEGEKKALSAKQEGFNTISLPGVDNWHNPGSTALHNDLARINWTGRTVFVVFDSDAATNPNVLRNETLLADALVKRGANVKIARLPAAPDGSKVGLDDYLVAKGPGELRALLDKADDPEPPPPEELRTDARKADPADLAETFLQSTRHATGLLKICYWRDSFYRWTRGRWEEIDDEQLKASLVSFLTVDHCHVTQAVASNVLMHCKAKAIRYETADPPFWLASPEPPINDLSAAMFTRGEIVDLATLQTVRATPAVFNTAATNCKYLGADAPKPERWLSFLAEIFDGESDSIEALQLWCGYLLTSDTSQQRMLLLIGPTRSGKGTVCRIVRELVGVENVVAPGTASFATQFGLSSMLNRSLAIVSDARTSNKVDGGTLLERLLSITGEDAQDVDRKYKAPITTKLPTRIMVVSNELPRFNDPSGAIAGRTLLLQTRGSWLGKENTNLTGELLDELPSILVWAIAGWHKLRERGSLIQPQSSAELLEEYRLLSSPVAEFIDQRCTMGVNRQCSRVELYNAFKTFCEANGRKNIPQASEFGRQLRAAVPILKDIQPRIDGKQVRSYEGVELKSEF